MMFTIETLRRDGMPIWNHWTVESIAEESDDSSIISIDDCYFINNEQAIHYAQIYDHQIEYDQFAESIDIETPIHANVLEHQCENIFESVQVNKMPLEYLSKCQNQTSVLTRSFMFDGNEKRTAESHKSLSIFNLFKKCCQRSIQSELNPLTNEPVLLHLKSLDKQQMFVDLNALETYYQTQLLATTMSTRLKSSYRDRLRKFFKIDRFQRKVFI